MFRRHASPDTSNSQQGFVTQKMQSERCTRTRRFATGSRLRAGSGLGGGIDRDRAVLDDDIDQAEVAGLLGGHVAVALQLRLDCR